MTTRLIATLGPASWNPEGIQSLLAAGATQLRLNLSHLDAEGVLALCARIRTATGGALPVVADLPGRKMRTGDLLHPLTLQAGQQVFLGPVSSAPPETVALPADLPPGFRLLAAGSPVLLRDGRLALEILGATPEGLLCRVILGGEAVSRMGLTLPGAPVSGDSYQLPEGLLEACLEAGVRSFLLSFCDSPDDLACVAGRCTSLDCPEVELIPKYETPAALESAEAILDACETACIARGDLGTHLPLPRLAHAEADLLRLAGERRRRLIVAGEVLPGFLTGTRATRPEAVAVYHELAAGAAGFILSDETAVGPDPVGAVTLLAAVVREFLG